MVPKSLRVARDYGAHYGAGGAGDRLGGGHACGGRCGRPSGGRSGCRRRASGARLRVGRHQRRGVRTPAAAAGRPPVPHAHLLPCRAQRVACDGRDVDGGRRAAVVSRDLRARHAVRRAGGRGGGGSCRRGGAAVRAVFVGRAHAVPRPAGARGVCWADAGAHPRALHARRAGRRRVRAARLAGDPAGDGRPAARVAPDGRRREKPALAADSRQRVRATRSHPAGGRGSRLRRRAAGGGGRRRVELRARSVRGDRPTRRHDRAQSRRPSGLRATLPPLSTTVSPHCNRFGHSCVQISRNLCSVGRIYAPYPIQGDI
jgi:hypothetical protein